MKFNCRRSPGTCGATRLRWYGRYPVPNGMSGTPNTADLSILPIRQLATSSISLPFIKLFCYFRKNFPSPSSSPLFFLDPLKGDEAPTSLGQGPFQRIPIHKMSTATEKAAAPKLEKKPVKFSNLLLGAGLNMFEVTSLGQVRLSPFIHWSPPTRHNADNPFFPPAAGSDQDDHGRQSGRQLRRCYESDLGPWRDPRLYVTPSPSFFRSTQLVWGGDETHSSDHSSDVETNQANMATPVL